MKIRLVACGFVLGAASALLTGRALSQDGAAMPSPAEMQEMMEAYMASLQPGRYHELLDSSIGTWNTTTRMWWAGPGSEPNITRGTAKRTWVLGGRFVLEELHSDMMMPDPEAGGMSMKTIPMEGMGLFGYDNFRQIYVGAWAESIGTQLLTMKGTVDPAGKVFTWYGEMDEPMLGVVGRYVKYVTRVIDQDTQVFEVFDLHVGEDYKVVEVTYTRSK